MFEDFIGQKRIILELEAICIQLKSKFSGVNILLRGQAGCGKTLLAKTFLSSIDNYAFQLPNKNNGYELVWNKKCETFRCHFIDEIHLLKNPEVLYPLMDSKQYVFIFASNEYGELPDALLSRCFIYSFFDYTFEEISEIIYNYALTKNIPMEKSLADLFAKYSRNNPRIVKNLFDRALFIIKRGYYTLNTKGITSALNDIGIYDGGYTDLDMKYMKILSNSNTMGIDSLSRVLKVDKNTIINEIEPFLLNKGHIEISPRGRKFIKW